MLSVSPNTRPSWQSSPRMVVAAKTHTIAFDGLLEARGAAGWPSKRRGEQGCMEQQGISTAREERRTSVLCVQGGVPVDCVVQPKKTGTDNRCRWSGSCIRRRMVSCSSLTGRCGCSVQVLQRALRILGADTRGATAPLPGLGQASRAHVQVPKPPSRLPQPLYSSRLHANIGLSTE